MLQQPVGLWVVDGRPQVFNLQQMAQINHETRTLVCKDVLGDPHGAKQLHRFSGDVLGGGFLKCDPLRVSCYVVHNDEDLFVAAG